MTTDSPTLRDRIVDFLQNGKPLSHQDRKAVSWLFGRDGGGSMQSANAYLALHEGITHKKPQPKQEDIEPSPRVVHIKDSLRLSNPHAPSAVEIATDTWDHEFWDEVELVFKNGVKETFLIEPGFSKDELVSRIAGLQISEGVAPTINAAKLYEAYAREDKTAFWVFKHSASPGV